MFTGLVETMGRVVSLARHAGDARLTVCADLPGPGDIGQGDLAIGDSIAINGVCLTVVAQCGREFSADVSAETLSCTTLGTLDSLGSQGGGWTCGQFVNLERALLPDTRLGGHFVSGHVDGVADIILCQDRGESRQLSIRVPACLSCYIAAKGSIAVDGVSLTVNQVKGDCFEVNIIPHTLNATNLGRLLTGAHVNIEVDLIARYLERLMLPINTHKGIPNVF